MEPKGTGPKGIRILGAKAVPKGTLPQAPSLSDITTVVPQMFGKKVKVNIGLPKLAERQIQPKPKPKVEPVVQPLAEPVVQPLAPQGTEPVVQPLAPQGAEPVVQPLAEEETKEEAEEDDEEEAEEDAETDVQPLAETAVQPMAETQPLAEQQVQPNTKKSKKRLVLPNDDEKEVPPKLIELQSAVRNQEKTDNYTLEKAQIYIPETSRSFSKFITTTFKDFALPPRPKEINYEACSTLEMRIYEYQKFIREYMRQASPYRGILVYHGLGSGKTCTSIATAEALYGNSNKRIIIMTPISLQENFLNEISVCGFQHFRLQNHWTSFSLTDETERLFAQEVVSIPATHIKKVLKSPNPSDRVFWMPDFTKPSNYNDLPEKDKTAIRTQIRAIIMNRITFIGYTGITHDNLKQIACDRPKFFDDAVIIIDEVHNLTRLMRGKLEKYLKNVRADMASVAPQPGKKPKKIPFSYEPMTTDVWKPKLCGSSQKYDRAFLIYRLLAQARNSKIIALSGTPIVNFPEEVGILCNMLHGYFHTVEDRITALKDDDLKALELVLKLHPSVQYYHIQKGEGYSTVFFTKIEDKYYKKFEGNNLEGIGYDEDLEPQTIQELYQEVVKKAAPIKFMQKPIFSALPLFPETTEEFEAYFVDKTNFTINNKLLFQKRITGLISYYKGAKKELMPTVVNDEIVPCIMSNFAMGPYAEARGKEREEKKGTTSASAWDELQDLSKESSTSYRFRSRAACNFVFPKGIPRPFPSNKKEFKESAKVEDVVLGDTEADAVEDDLASQGVAEQIGLDNPDEEDEEEEVNEVLPSALAAEDTRIPYQDRIRIALDALRSIAKRRFSLDSSKPEEEQLENYSSKFVEIMKRIEASPGSSLIYSQFKTLEGIGIFSIVLDANGYAPIKLVGPENDLRFSDDTEQSLLKSPEQPRYIIYSGEETKTVRQTLINIFNTKLSSLPPRIVEVLTESGLIDAATKKGNYKGEICKVFMITGAGAEGLSLRNVRTVHIMEPYWNTVRTDQVKGRAVRICSHSDLPYNADPSLNQRTVEIFTYVSILNPDKRFVDQTLILQDDGKTTDEHILSISNAKLKLGSAFLTSMKEAAVDCTLNLTENEAIGCFTYDGPSDKFMYDPRIKEDLTNTNRELRLNPAAAAKPSLTAMAAAVAPKEEEYKVIQYKKVQYTVVPKEGRDALFLVSDRLFEKEVGKLYTTDAGKLKVELY